MDEIYGMTVEKVPSAKRSVVKGGRAILTLLASPDRRRKDRYIPDEGRFVFNTPMGFSTHFDPKQDNGVNGYVGQVINHDSNGLGTESQKASSLVTLGENLFFNNGRQVIPSGSKFVVLTPDAITVFGADKFKEDKLSFETHFKKLYHETVNPVKDREGRELFPPLVLPYQQLFSETGLVKRTSRFWVRSYDAEYDDEDTTHFNNILVDNDEPVTLARSPALFVTSLRNLVGTVTEKQDGDLDNVMEKLSGDDKFIRALEGLLKASHAWHSITPVFLASSTTDPGAKGTCQTKMG